MNISFRFEIIVVLDGTCLATSLMSRTTTSYLSTEIKWGHRFKPCTEYDPDRNMYIVDHSIFNKTEEIDTPLCSSQILRDIYQKIFELAAPKLSLSPSTSKYSSPLFSSLKISKAWPEEEEEQSSSVVTTSAVVHTEKMEGRKKEESSSEEELVYEDLSVEDLTEENIKSLSNLGGKKDMFQSLQNFVLEDNTKRLKIGSSERMFAETSF